MLELRQSHRPGQAHVLRALRDAGEVIGVRLVRREDEPGLRMLRHQIEKRAQHDAFVGRPGGAGNDRERPGGRGREARQRLAGAVEALGAVDHAVEPRVAGDAQCVGPHPQLLQALAVVAADRAHAIERAVGRTGPPAHRPAQPAALGRYGGGDQAEPHAGVGGGERQLRPHVELAVHQRGGLQCRQHVAGAVERAVVRHVHGQRARQPLRRR